MPGGALVVVFTAANMVILAGYVAVPFLVLPYLPLSRPVLVSGGGFFIGCAGSHLWLAFGMHAHEHAGAYGFWTVWHVVQAVCTWVFILGFRRALKAAQRIREGRGGQ